MKTTVKYATLEDVLKLREYSRKVVNEVNEKWDLDLSGINFLIEEFQN